MQRYKKISMAALCVFALGAPSLAVAQTYVDGVGAYKNSEYRKAFAVWSALAAAGDREAQYSLGVLYEEGQGVSQDDRKAVEWFLQSANSGHAEAQFNVGVAYWSGVGVPVDRSKAIEYWEKAARRGLSDAQYNLGVAYAEGYGVDKNLKTAIHWFGEAQKNNHPRAQPAAHFYSLELQDERSAQQTSAQGQTVAQVSTDTTDSTASGVESVSGSANDITATVTTTTDSTEQVAQSTNALTQETAAEAGNAGADEIAITIGGHVQPRANDTPMVVRPNTNLIFQTLSDNQRFEVIEIEGNWVKVGGEEGVFGWMHGDFVEVTGAQGVLTGDSVRIRPMPNTLNTSVPMGVMNFGDRVTVISEENGWVRVRLGLPFGGWVRMDRLKAVQ